MSGSEPEPTSPVRLRATISTRPIPEVILVRDASDSNPPTNELRRPSDGPLEHRYCGRHSGCGPAESHHPTPGGTARAPWPPPFAIEPGRHGDQPPPSRGRSWLSIQRVVSLADGPTSLVGQAGCGSEAAPMRKCNCRRDRWEDMSPRRKGSHRRHPEAQLALDALRSGSEPEPTSPVRLRATISTRPIPEVILDRIAPDGDQATHELRGAPDGWWVWLRHTPAYMGLRPQSPEIHRLRTDARKGYGQCRPMDNPQRVAHRACKTLRVSHTDHSPYYYTT